MYLHCKSNTFRKHKHISKTQTHACFTLELVRTCFKIQSATEWNTAVGQNCGVSYQINHNLVDLVYLQLNLGTNSDGKPTIR
jgi:hypothetical protein